MPEMARGGETVCCVCSWQCSQQEHDRNIATRPRSQAQRGGGGGRPGALIACFRCRGPPVRHQWPGSRSRCGHECPAATHCSLAAQHISMSVLVRQAAMSASPSPRPRAPRRYRHPGIPAPMAPSLVAGSLARAMHAKPCAWAAVRRRTDARELTHWHIAGRNCTETSARTHG